MITKLSIIIVSFNTEKLLEETIKSIYSSEKDNSFFEIIVVDNNSSDKSIKMVKEKFGQVKLIINSKNLGFGAANNLGAKNAKGEYLLFLNSDTIVQSEALTKMVDFFKKNKRVGILGPKLVLNSGKIQPYCIGYKSSLGQSFKNRFAKCLAKLKINKKFLTRLSLEYWDWLEPRSVDWVTGAALMIRKNLFDKVHGFDEKIFMYFEDQDLCLKANQLNQETWVLPNAEIIHLGGKSIKLDNERKKYYYQSQDYFFKKHFGKFSYLLMKIISFPVRILST
jgi:GT2 family glycosyltransferase